MRGNKSNTPRIWGKIKEPSMEYNSHVKRSKILVVMDTLLANYSG